MEVTIYHPAPLCMGATTQPFVSAGCAPQESNGGNPCRAGERSKCRDAEAKRPLSSQGESRVGFADDAATASDNAQLSESLGWMGWDGTDRDVDITDSTLQ